MTHFPCGSNTRNNTLAYKYTRKKSTDFRQPRGLEDGSQRWNWRNVRLVTCTMLCSFVLQTLRSSVRSFYKLYEALFVRSTNSTKLCSFVLQTLRNSFRLFYKFKVCSVRLIFIWTLLWSVRSTKVWLFFELIAQAPALLERTLYTENVLYLVK